MLVRCNGKTVTLIHPAHTIAFGDLFAQLQAARAQRLVVERDGPDGLKLYRYSENCVYEGAWTLPTIAARGLILHPATAIIVATPFPKFFNLGERGTVAPDLPFVIAEKLDGSLIIIYHHQGRWRASTKGSFDSDQALWAQARLAALDLSQLTPGTTYLAEAVYPENRIVIRYDVPALVMLAAYSAQGVELEAAVLADVCAKLGLRMAQTSEFASMAALVDHARALPRSQEGYVIRFSNSLRLKLKGDEYKRVHALIAGVTPLGIWELMHKGDDTQSIRRELPEELWGDFDQIVSLLSEALARLLARVAQAAGAVEGQSDKEVGLHLASFEAQTRSFIFPWRKSGGKLLEGRNRQAVFFAIRPDANSLPGYKPSFAMHRAMAEAE